jgi:hypothetical protein
VHDVASLRKGATTVGGQNGTPLARSFGVPFSTSHIVTLSLLLAACVTGDIGEGQDPGLDEIDYQVDNGIFLPNGLNLPNGMNLGNGAVLANGMNLGNGIDLTNGMNLGNGLNLGNGITGPFYAPPTGSGLEQWIDVDPPMRKRTLRYLIECALPAGVAVQLRYRGTLEVLGRGVLGLGPTLQKGAMPAAEQEKVSACLLARVNAEGKPVSVDLFGPMPGMNTATSAELDLYSAQEGVFFGNLFLDTPVASACALDVISRDGFRACKTDGCGVLAPFWKLSTKGWGGVVLKDCFRDSVCQKASLGGGSYYAASCTGTRVWAYPITTRLVPADAGEECYGTYQCMRGLDCVSGVCQ